MFVRLGFGVRRQAERDAAFERSACRRTPKLLVESSAGLDFGLWARDFILGADEPRRAQKNPAASGPVSRFGSEGPSLDFHSVPASVRAGVVELVGALAKIRRCTVARRFARGVRR